MGHGSPTCQTRYNLHDGYEFVGVHLIYSWVATDQVRALSSDEAELYVIVDESDRCILTQDLMDDTCHKWWVEAECDSADAIATRWLWIQVAVRNEQINLQKSKGMENMADIGTKAIDGKHIALLLKQLTLALPQCRRFLGVLAALAQAAKVGHAHG